ncbi:MAG: hypothetical protein O3C40_06525 [Planctomycetota bacterium]|nr:hypothetical protein [Planctomycetota bacterium]
MENSSDQWWSPGPTALAVPAEIGETLSLSEWRERLRERIELLAEDAPLNLADMWLERTDHFPSIRSPGDIVDTPEFLEMLERHQVSQSWFPMEVEEVVEDSEVEHDLQMWMNDLILPLRD